MDDIVHGVTKSQTRLRSDLENSMDDIVHGVTKSQTRLRDFHLVQANRASLD